MSTGFTDEQEQELLKLTNKTISFFFSFGVSRSLVIFSRAECWMQDAWLQMWGEEK